jgi:uncharacterized protein (DUF3820 family)
MRIEYGKHKGMEIDDLIEQYPSYAMWILRQKSTLDKVYYQKLKNAFQSPNSFIMNWGKYKGRSLQYIQINDPNYIDWLRRNEFVNSGKCPFLVDYLNNIE